jgi:hypothetical protein
MKNLYLNFMILVSLAIILVICGKIFATNDVPQHGKTIAATSKVLSFKPTQ